MGHSLQSIPKGLNTCNVGSSAWKFMLRHGDNFVMYMEVISEVEQTVDILDLTRLIVGGDFNTDLIRYSPHAVILISLDLPLLL